MFTERTRLVVYMETADLQRITETAREAGKTVVEWAREVLLEIGEPKAVREPEPVRVAKRRSNVLERLPVLADAGSAASAEEDVRVSEGRGASERTCKHGTPKGWRCWQCGGVAIIE